MRKYQLTLEWKILKEQNDNDTEDLIRLAVTHTPVKDPKKWWYEKHIKRIIIIRRRRTEKTVEHEGNRDTNCNWCTRYRHPRISKGSRRLGNERKRERSTRILKRIQETWGDLLSLRLHWKSISLRWCEKLIIIIIITNKWYMHNPAAVLENNTHKLLWDFDIQTDHLI